jgi:hypothetical protein
MGTGMGNHAALAAKGTACRLVVRKEKGLSEILQFVAGGLEIGQQVVVMAGPVCLREIARGLSENGLRPENMLHNGRLIFLTAPNCLAQLAKAGDPLQRGPLHRNGSMLRWVSDWSWAYEDGAHPATILGYQRLIHEFARSLNALSLCTVHCESVQRGSLLALLADHRRAARTAQNAAPSAHA